MRVFVSYRRADTQAIAGRMADYLRDVPGVDRVLNFAACIRCNAADGLLDCVRDDEPSHPTRRPIGLADLIAERSLEAQARYIRANRALVTRHAAMHYWLKDRAIEILNGAIDETRAVLSLIEASQ